MCSSSGFILIKVSNNVLRNWNEECERAKINKKTPNFKKVFWKTFLWTFFLNGFTTTLAVSNFFVFT